MKASEVLKEARKLIAEKGWIQRSYHSSQGYCVLGALRCCRGSTPYALDYLEAVTGGIFPHWNDYPFRTKDEVLDAFDKAISRAEVDESSETRRV